MEKQPAPTQKPRAHVRWRVLSLVYDFFPAFALWMVLGAIFAVAYTLAGHDKRENIAPFSALQLLLWLCCWVVTGFYAVVSWGRGGQTLGMRPWRLKVVSTDALPPSSRALWIRYAMGTLSLLLGGLGFWWAWFDRDKLTWHDRASGTRMVRLPK